MEQNVANTVQLPIDGHVHLYSRERAEATCNAAARNFSRYGANSGDVLGIMMVTETANENVFEELAKSAACGDWAVDRASAEEESLVLRRDQAVLIMISGRQIRCDDGLEVAALGTLQPFPDGLPFEDTIGLVQKAGALTVIPWGFGKWLGRRRKSVAELFRNSRRGSIAFGDSGSRPNLWQPSQIITQAHQHGFSILSGSDPFPCGDDYKRVGSCGFYSELLPGFSNPWKDLFRWLLSRGRSPENFGEGTGVIEFVRNQIGIRRYNRLIEERIR